MTREQVAGVELLWRPGAGGIVLLHGIGSDAATWAPMMAALDPALAVMAWDAPGYGQSAPLPEVSPTPTHYADRLAAVLDGLGWDRVVLVGHSLGALFAARFAVLHPRRVRGLMLLSPALGYGVTAGAALPPNVQARIDDLDALGPEEFAAKRAARLVYRPHAKADVLAGVRRAMAAVNPAGYAQAVRALAAGSLLTDAACIIVPSVVAVGAEDVVTPPPNAQAVREALVQARALALVPDVGHALPQEAPEAVAGMLTALTAEVADV
jgi:pimeloyl-ACP methyl ester carboxylesterase